MDEPPKKREPLGRILLTQRVVTTDALEKLLEEQRDQPDKRLGALARESGAVSRYDILKALSEQHGIPAVDLRQAVIALAHLKLIPEDIARQHHLLPLQATADQLVIAVADPADRRIVDELEFVTGRTVRTFVALFDELAHLITTAYQAAEGGKSHFVGPDVPPETIQELGLRPEDLARRVSMAPDASPPLTPSLIPTIPPAVVKAVSEPPETRWAMLSMPAPGDAAAQARTASVPRGLLASDKKRVLVVDDEEDIRKLLRRLLTDAGYDVVEAERGFEALEKVKTVAPDLLVLDAMLPEVHGFEICRRIKGSRRYGHIPIIMVSAIYRGWRMAEDLVQSYGVTAFIEKPFKLQDVLAAVKGALEGGGEARPAPSDAALSAEAEALYARGMEAHGAGQPDLAATLLREGLTVDPLAFRLHYTLGLVEGRAERTFEAIHALETAVDLDPKHFGALKNLAVLYQKAGFKNKSVELWERALRAAPDEETRAGIKEHLMSLL